MLSVSTECLYRVSLVSTECPPSYIMMLRKLLAVCLLSDHKVSTLQLYRAQLGLASLYCRSMRISLYKFVMEVMASLWESSGPAPTAFASFHTHTPVLTTIFPGESGLAGCPRGSSPLIPKLHILLGQAMSSLTQSHQVFLGRPLSSSFSFPYNI